VAFDLIFSSYRSGIFEISASWMRIPDAWILGNWEFTILGIIINHVFKPSLVSGHATIQTYDFC
jgi:hypothetical protein